MTLVRILSYNVRSLRDDTDALTRIVRVHAPDVLVVQEAPRFVGWRRRCADLARRCAMVYVAGGRTAGDNLLLCSPHAHLDPESTIERRVPRAPFRPIGGVVAAGFDIAGTRFAVVGCHLGLARAERRVEVAEVVDVLGRLEPEHVIVAGDLNEPPDGRSWRVLAQAGLRDPAPGVDDPTFPSAAPRARIDAILVSTGITAVEYGVPTDRHDPGHRADYTRATDHLPVLATLEIP